VRKVITCTVYYAWDVYVRHSVFIKENVERHGEMTNAYEILVGNFQDKDGVDKHRV